jgi:hypothetical protein
MPLAPAYPPSDPPVVEWFSTNMNRTEQGTTDRCHAFLHALLDTTLSHLEEICEDKTIDEKLQAEPSHRLHTLASEFRNRMAKGQTFETHGDYRRNFYDIVFERAAKVVLPSFPSTGQSF